jgi:hypothetical protein
MRRTPGRRISAGLAVAALAAAAAIATVSPAGAASENLPGVPAPGSSDAAWQKWADAERAQAEQADWAADSRTRGCTLVEATVVDEVDAAYNAAMGAPADLSTHRVDMVEECPEPAAGTLATGGLTSSDKVSTQAIGSGNRCASTHGPGTICVSSSGGRIYASWKYSGSGSVSGFLRIYRIPTSADSCYRGDTWLTGPSSTWSSGMTRSVSKARTTYSGYSAHIWKKVAIGHTDWGRACSKL